MPRPMSMRDIETLKAAENYILHCGGDVTPHPQERLLNNLRILMVEQTPTWADSHYEFLDHHLDDFWQAVLGKSLSDSFCAGIVSAHGDKGYCYRRQWAEKGIHFYHGMMIFLLTYTDIMDRPMHEAGQWVIDNYERFKPHLPPLSED